MSDPYSLTEARAHLGELVARARHTHRPVPITEHGKPTVAIVNIDDLPIWKIAPHWLRITPTSWPAARVSRWPTWMQP